MPKTSKNSFQNVCFSADSIFAPDHSLEKARNLAHKELVSKMDAWLRRLGAIPKENDHIDLFADVPSDGSFIFEVKSGGENLLDQIRKGLSQLYEYRYNTGA